jgi:hypothetical protein
MKMATVELGPDHADHTAIVQNPALRRPLFPAIRWGAVLAGVAVGVSVQLALALLGIATGLSAVDIAEGDNPGAIGPLVWAGISMLIAAFVGGYVAARMSGLKRKADGILHGAVSWAVTTLMFATLATSMTGTLLSSVFSSVAPVARSAATQGGSSPVVSMLRQQLGDKADAASVQQLQQHIQAGRRDEAIQLMTGRMGVDQNKAATVVDQALIVSGSPDQASPQARETADKAVSNASKAAWGVFLAVALSLALGIGGGIVGANGSRRTSWASGNMAHA